MNEVSAPREAGLHWHTHPRDSDARENWKAPSA